MPPVEEAVALWERHRVDGFETRSLQCEELDHLLPPVELAAAPGERHRVDGLEIHSLEYEELRRLLPPVELAAQLEERHHGAEVEQEDRLPPGKIRYLYHPDQLQQGWRR